MSETPRSWSRRPWLDPKVAKGTALGATHERSGLPNQDAVLVVPDPPRRGDPLVVAIADGHGSVKSFRSDLGATYAVRIAADVLRRQRLPVPPADEGLPNPGLFEAVLRQLTDRWTAEVERHLEEHPLDQDDRLRQLGAGRDVGVLGALEGNPLLAYGSTALAVVVTRDGLYYFQLGDGDILTVRADGVDVPVPEDPRLFGNETTSLCQPEAWRQFRVGFDSPERAPRLVLLATDGYRNSFAGDEAFFQVGPDLLNIVEQGGIDAVRAGLPAWLEETTQLGAGDDVTLAVVELRAPGSTGRAAAGGRRLPSRPPTEQPAPPPTEQPAAGSPSSPEPEPATVLLERRDRRDGDPARARVVPTRARPRPRTSGRWLVAVLLGSAIVALALVAFLLTRAGKPDQPPGTTVAAPPDLARLRSAIVRVEPDGSSGTPAGGVVVSDDGLVVTTTDVTAGAVTASTKPRPVLVHAAAGQSGALYPGAVVRDDPGLRLALVRLDSPPPQLPSVEIAQAVPQPGEELFVPSLAGTATQTVRVQASDDPELWIQVDPPPIAGSDGVPIADRAGRLVGMVVAAPQPDAAATLRVRPAGLIRRLVDQAAPGSG